MYSSRGSSNAYGQQQPYSSQSSYTPQDLGAARMLGGGPQEGEMSGYRAHGHVHGQEVTDAPPSHYGGQYGSVYGSGAQKMSPMGTKGSATTLEGRSNYAPSMPKSPKFAPNEYVSSSNRGYGQKVEQLYSDRMSEYTSVDRHRYAERHSAYLGRDLPSETANRYVDSVAFGHDQQSKLYEHLEQATVLRQEQALKAHMLQSASVEGGARQADYLAARAGVFLPAQDAIAYGGRVDPESRSLSLIGGSSYSGQHTTSILGAAPHRSVDDLIYAQSTSNPGYGVSLPPGRDYGLGKGLHGTSLESDYPSNMLGRVGHLRVDDRKDDRGTYGRELERREKDRDYLRAREKSREREKDRLRERERERERERDRERERERERRRERERKEERDRENKRELELKRERTPSRASRDRRGSSLAKDIRPIRRESPHREVSHRPHSPVKEKRREYSCKVFPFSFIEDVRDYLSLDKRYPRLYISPECSKVVVCWPKNNLQLSLYTPVSFEHDFVEEASVEKKELPSTQLATNISKAKGQPTIWNAKIILMSGLSGNAQAELSSDRTYDDRIPHFCNMLRFAVLKKNNSLMAIGGPWDTVDGLDPSVDNSSLLQTARRYAKDVTDLDLKNCQRWNRFLEIHYQRVGKDGLFSHNEVTVLYVPDLSECLPSLDSWRDQWLNHKRAVSERERLHAMKKEIPGDKEETPKDKKKLENVKDSKAKVELQKKKELSSSDNTGDDSKKKKDAQNLENKGTLIPEEGKGKEKAVEDRVVVGSAEEEKNVVKTVEEGKSNSQTAVGAKTGKKKIIKRIIKKMVPKKKNGTEIAKKQNITEIAAEQNSTEIATKQNGEVDKESARGKDIISEVDGKQDDLPGNPPSVKTFVRKRIVKKAVNSALEKNEGSTPETKTAKEPGSSEDKAKVKSEEASTNTTVKKKVVRKVPKKKDAPAANNDKVAADDLKGGEKVVHSEHVEEEQKEESVQTQVKKVISKDKNSPKVKTEKKADKKNSFGSLMETDSLKQKVAQNDNSKKSKKEEVNDDKERRDVEKNESESKSNKMTKEKNRDEAPRHPGLFLQTKGNKDSKVQSLSLSLDSLLDYNDNDIDESTFELLLFAESLYEMLQYEMGSRLLGFLQKLRIKFVAKRNQGKRQRKENENEESSSRKRVKKMETLEDVKSTKTENKTDKNVVDIKSTKTESKKDKNMEDTKSTKTENTEDAHEDDSNMVKEETNATKKTDEVKIEDEMEEEDPEEDPEEDEEMPEANTDQDPTKEETLNEEKTTGDAVGEDIANHEQKKLQESVKQTSEVIINPDPSNKDKLTKVEAKTKEILGGINKELLQAFRFFDRNRVGYIRVEDLRLIIHNLGKFLSHRDVKELVQSALLESNTGRDDRILYDKLVKMSDILN